jgi:hypothetical protein
MIKTIKVLLNIKGTEKDNLLNTLISLKSGKVTAALHSETVPAALEYVIIELVINHYNKLGSEGLSAESVEGISRTYIDSANELEPYASVFGKYLNSRTGMFRFY